MRKTSLIAAPLGSAALAARTTDVLAFAAKWSEPGELQVVDHTVELAEAGEWDAMKASFHESVADVGSDEVWATIAATLAGADLAGRTLIGVNVNAATHHLPEGGTRGADEPLEDEDPNPPDSGT